jgi:surface antigen
MLAPWHIRRSVPALLLLAIAMPALAQWRDVRPHGNPMTRTDLDHQGGSARSLLEAEPAPVGGSREWRNPETGAYGTVTLLNVLQRRGAPCRALRYVYTTRGSAQPSEMSFTLCRTAEGEWKIAE